jgi:hypothetical protein
MVVGLAQDEPLLERLRVLVSDPTTDVLVKRKAIELFGSWSVNFKDQQGMERLVKLRSQTPSKVFPCYVLTRNVLSQQSVHQPLKTNL